MNMGETDGDLLFREREYIFILYSFDLHHLRPSEGQAYLSSADNRLGEWTKKTWARELRHSGCYCRHAAVATLASHLADRLQCFDSVLSERQGIPVCHPSLIPDDLRSIG